MKERKDGRTEGRKEGRKEGKAGEEKIMQERKDGRKEGSKKRTMVGWLVCLTDSTTLPCSLRSTCYHSTDNL